MADQFAAYRRVNVETASQEKLIVMLFNGAIQRALDAKSLMEHEKPDIQEIHKKLIRAQEIITELRASLDIGTGEVAQNLDRIYEYFVHQLVQANIKKDPKFIDDLVPHMQEIRDAWQEAFKQNGGAEAPAPDPSLNQHGAQVMNLEG